MEIIEKILETATNSRNEEQRLPEDYKKYNKLIGCIFFSFCVCFLFFSVKASQKIIRRLCPNEVQRLPEEDEKV